MHYNSEQFMPGCDIDESAPSEEKTKKTAASPQTTAKK
jgi:hypothetical protein